MLKLTPEQRAALEAQKTNLAGAGKEADAMMSVRAVKNSVDFVARFKRIIVRKSDTSVAAEGQAGGAKSADAKDPPTTLLAVPLNVEELVLRATDETTFYTPVGPDSIRIHAYLNKKTKDAATAAFVAAQNALKEAKATPAGPTPLQEEAYRVAEEGMAKANASQGTELIANNKGLFISCFAKAECAKLKPGCIIMVKGCTGAVSFSKKDGRKFLGAQCESVIVTGEHDNPLVLAARYLDPYQQPVRREGGAQYGDETTLLFGDYVRTPEDTAANRGPVVQRMLVCQSEEKDWKWKKQDDKGEEKLKGEWKMWQQQDPSPGYPSQTTPFYVVASIFEGAWDDDSKDNKLRKGFGINSAETFAKMMVANPVPALFDVATNTKKVDATKGQPHLVPYYVNKATFFLRSYLLTNCARVSFQWVRRMFGIKPTIEDEDVSINKDNTKRLCLLNRDNIVTNSDGIDTFTGDKVVNVSSYKGNIGQLAKQGCEFRVMISAPLDSQARERLAEASTELAEKTLDRMDGALFMLPDGYVRVLYAVVPYTDAETNTINDALGSWRERRERIATAAAHYEAHFAHHASNQSGEAVGMDIADDDAAAAAAAAAEEDELIAAAAAVEAQATAVTATATASVKTESHPQEEDEAELALAAQIAEEQAQMRKQAQEEAELAEEREQMRRLEEAEAVKSEKKKRSRSSPAPSGEKPASQGKKKSTKTQN